MSVFTPGAASAGSDPFSVKLSQLTKEELNELLNNEDAFEKFMDETENPSLAMMDENINTMEGSVKATADENILLQSQVKNLFIGR